MKSWKSIISPILKKKFKSKGNRKKIIKKKTHRKQWRIWWDYNRKNQQNKELLFEQIENRLGKIYQWKNGIRKK